MNSAERDRNCMKVMKVSDVMSVGHAQSFANREFSVWMKMSAPAGLKEYDMKTNDS